MEDEIFDDLPADPEMAFLKLERVFREDCGRGCGRDSENASLYQADYIAQVIGAIEELGLTGEFESEVPSIDAVNHQTYLEFNKDVMHYCTRLRIRTARRASGYSVKFDEAAKIKLRHYIEQIRETVGLLEVEERKRNALFGRLSALELEVNRDRTRIEVYGDLVVVAAGLVGEAGEKLEPVRKLLDSMARVFNEARGAVADVLQIPGPRKQIEHKPPSKPTDFARDLDDEVPF